MQSIMVCTSSVLPNLKSSIILPAILAFLACSGTQPQTSGAPSSASERDDGSFDSSSGQPSSSAPDPCRDGTCFVCGDGICPLGYFCDESGEPACAWLPACAATATCPCVTAALGSACTCQARGDGAFVSCP
jgi:hypothetical protein